MEERCSETSAHKIQKPGNYREESIQHPEYGESLESRTTYLFKHCDKHWEFKQQVSYSRK